MMTMAAPNGESKYLCGLHCPLNHTWLSQNNPMAMKEGINFYFVLDSIFFLFFFFFSFFFGGGVAVLNILSCLFFKMDNRNI